MAPPFSLEQLDRLRSGVRRLSHQAATLENDMQRLLETAQLDSRDAHADLFHSTGAARTSEHQQESIDALSAALRNQISRTTASVEVARRLCLSARQHQLAMDRLTAEVGDGVERSPGTRGGRNAVLVVDDYQDTRELLSMVLQGAGFVVRTETNGLDAVIAAYELQPAVIVMDMMMPVLDGIEATRLIKAIDELRHASVIAYTAKSSLANLTASQQKLDHLFSAVLSKPSPPDLVVATVQRFAAASA